MTFARSLSPVVKYHGLARCHLSALGLLMRPLLNGGRLGGPMAHGHAYVTICGFGKRIVPVSSPCEFALQQTDVAIMLGGKRTLVTTADAPAEFFTSNSDVVDVVSGPQDSAWWIDAGKFRVPFPVGWTVFADGSILPPFFLEGPLEQTLFIQIANNVPTGEALVASYQSVVARGLVGPYESLEVAYQHEGRSWLQRHTVLTVESKPYAVLTAQAPLEAFAAARDLHISIATDIVFA